MKTYKDIYSLPLRASRHSWVYDSKHQFVFQFETQYDEKGDHIPKWMEFEKNILEKINGTPFTQEQQEAKFPERIALCHSELSEALEGSEKTLWTTTFPKDRWRKWNSRIQSSEYLTYQE